MLPTISWTLATSKYDVTRNRPATLIILKTESKKWAKFIKSEFTLTLTHTLCWLSTGWSSLSSIVFWDVAVNQILIVLFSLLKNFLFWLQLLDSWGAQQFWGQRWRLCSIRFQSRGKQLEWCTMRPPKLLDLWKEDSCMSLHMKPAKLKCTLFILNAQNPISLTVQYILQNTVLWLDCTCDWPACVDMELDICKSFGLREFRVQLK